MSVSFFNFDIDFVFKNQNIRLKLDLNNKNFLIDFKIEGHLAEHDFDYLQNILSHGRVNKIDIFALFRNSINEDIGPQKRYLLWIVYSALHESLNTKVLSSYEKESKAESPLICRCMGVTREMIERTISDKKIRDMFGLTNALNVGAGCASCVDDVLSEFNLVKKVYDEQEDSTHTSITKDKVKEFSYKGNFYSPAKLLIEILFPRAKEEGVKIESLIESSLYVKKDTLNENFKALSEEIGLNIIEA